MTQGIFINGVRPKSKKQVKEAVTTDPSTVYLEATSFFGNEYDGPITQMPEGKVCFFVGPDPERARNFFGNMIGSRLNECS